MVSTRSGAVPSPARRAGRTTAPPPPMAGARSRASSTPKPADVSIATGVTPPPPPTQVSKFVGQPPGLFARLYLPLAILLTFQLKPHGTPAPAALVSVSTPKVRIC